jgi:hypothetical protein
MIVSGKKVLTLDEFFSNTREYVGIMDIFGGIAAS